MVEEDHFVFDNIASTLLSGKVFWDDVVSSDPVSSARRFVNVFFVDQDVNVTDAVVAVRLPYDRVNITGTDPFTFSSNDVVRCTGRLLVRSSTHTV